MPRLVDFAAEQLHSAPDTEMSITIVSDEEIRRINREYRDTDRVTDVISFAIEDGDKEQLSGFEGSRRILATSSSPPVRCANRRPIMGTASSVSSATPSFTDSCT